MIQGGGHYTSCLYDRRAQRRGALCLLEASIMIYGTHIFHSYKHTACVFKHTSEMGGNTGDIPDWTACVSVAAKNRN